MPLFFLSSAGSLFDNCLQLWFNRFEAKFGPFGLVLSVKCGKLVVNSRCLKEYNVIIGFLFGAKIEEKPVLFGKLRLITGPAGVWLQKNCYISLFRGQAS
jgi:hypothetical protein